MFYFSERQSCRGFDFGKYFVLMWHPASSPGFCRPALRLCDVESRTYYILLLSLVMVVAARAVTAYCVRDRLVIPCGLQMRKVAKGSY
jgi:hypothetical protein